MKLKDIFTLLFGMFVLFSANAEAVDEPIELWNKTTGGSSWDKGYDVAVDSKDNIIVAGFTNSSGAGSYDVWIIKYDTNGNIIWNKTAGGSSWDEGQGVAVDSKDNIIIVGYTNSYGDGESDVWVIKYDSDGNLIWNKTAGGVYGDYGYDITIDKDDNIIVTGFTQSEDYNYRIISELWTIKYDLNGNIVWSKIAGEGHEGIGSGVTVDSNNNILVTGYTDSFGAGSYDAWTIKYDAGGNLMWNKTAGGSAADFGEDVAVDSNNNVIISGYRSSFDAKGGVWIIKYDSNGNLMWDKTTGGNSSGGDSGVAVDKNDNIIVTSIKYFGEENSDVWTIKYDPDGNLIWNETAGGNFRDEGLGVAVDSNNNIIVTGYINSSGNEIVVTGLPIFPDRNAEVWMIKYSQPWQFPVNSNNGKNQQEQQNQIPDSIIEKSNRFIISRVGEDFFKKYVTIDYNQSKYYPPDESCIPNPEWCAGFLLNPYYLMVYSFKIPGKPYANGLMEFAVDTDGELISGRDISGIPDCVNKPDECDFPVDETKAIDIAKDAGLKQGIKNFSASFHWYGGDLKTYVWTVENTLSEYNGRKNGETVVIDANSGRVHEVLVWEAESDTVDDGKEGFGVENGEVLKNTGNVDEKNFRWKTYVIPGMIISGLILLFILFIFILNSKNEKHKN